MFNIGMLHTSLTGSEQHDTYAPTSLEVLKSKAYDYWALGHIHLRNAEPLCVEPYVTYSGNPQGRHIREAGDKGCLIGEIDGETLKGVTFHSTDTLRWQELLVDVSEDKSLDAVLAKAGQAIQAQHARHAGLSSAFRLTFHGASKVHEELSDLRRRAEIHQQIFAAAESVDDEVWIEKIRFETCPANEATTRDAHELWQAIAQQFEQAQANSEATQQMQELVKPVLDKVTAAHINLSEEGTLDQRMPQWMEAAKQLLRSRLGAQES